MSDNTNTTTKNTTADDSSSSSSSSSSYPDANEISITYDNLNSSIPVAYECSYLLSSNANTFPEEIVPAYYNLVHPCHHNRNTTTTSSSSTNKIHLLKQLIEDALLEVAAQEWHIHPNQLGEGCTNPMLNQMYDTFLVGVSSKPSDEIVYDMDCNTPSGKGLPRFSNSSSLSSDNNNNNNEKCCIVIKSKMTFIPQGTYDSMDLIQFVMKTYDSNILLSSLSQQQEEDENDENENENGTTNMYQMYYAGSFSHPSGVLPNADTIDISQNRTDLNNGNTNTNNNNNNGVVSPATSNNQNHQNDKYMKQKETLTPIGIVMIIAFLGMIFGLCYVFFIVTRRRRRYNRQQLFQQQSELNGGNNNNNNNNGSTSMNKILFVDHSDQSMTDQDRNDDPNDDHNNNNMGGSGSGSGYEVTVMSDDLDVYNTSSNKAVVDDSMMMVEKVDNRTGRENDVEEATSANTMNGGGGVDGGVRATTLRQGLFLNPLSCSIPNAPIAAAIVSPKNSTTGTCPDPGESSSVSSQSGGTGSHSVRKKKQQKLVPIIPQDRNVITSIDSYDSLDNETNSGSNSSSTDDTSTKYNNNIHTKKKSYQPPRREGYAFDLGQSFKNDVMSAYSTNHHQLQPPFYHHHYHQNNNNNKRNHQQNQQQQQQQLSSLYSKSNPYLTNNHNNNHLAPTIIEVVPPYPMMEETSDSEADSWAQTDGTVGSLEERLEDITAEI